MIRRHRTCASALWGLSVLLTILTPRAIEAAPFSSGPPGIYTEQTYTEDGGSEPEDDDLTKELINLVNDRRRAAGLNEVTANETLFEAAAVRARELKLRFSHTRPDDTSFSTVFQDFNISFSEAGENLACGQLTPEEVMDDWMDSPGHKENLLYPAFTDIGVAHFTADGTNYWVQLFLFQ